MLFTSALSAFCGIIFVLNLVCFLQSTGVLSPVAQSATAIVHVLLLIRCHRFFPSAVIGPHLCTCPLVRLTAYVIVSGSRVRQVLSSGGLGSLGHSALCHLGSLRWTLAFYCVVCSLFIIMLSIVRCAVPNKVPCRIGFFQRRQELRCLCHSFWPRRIII